MNKAQKKAKERRWVERHYGKMVRSGYPWQTLTHLRTKKNRRS